MSKIRFKSKYLLILITKILLNIKTGFKLLKMVFLEEDYENDNISETSFNKITYSKKFFIEKTQKFIEPKIESNFLHNHIFFINKKVKININDNVLLLAIYVGESSLTNFQKKIIKTYKSVGYKVITIIACSDIKFYKNEETTGSDIEIIRENRGFDFGSWTTAINILPDLKNAKSITFTNDSICPVNYSKELLNHLFQKISNSDDDVIYLTKNEEIFSHQQSYFFCFKSSAIKKGILRELCFCPPNVSKYDLILEMEVGFSHLLKSKGYKIDTLYPYDGYFDNLLIKHWDKLIDDSFPFLKLKLFEDKIIKLSDEKVKKRISKENILDIEEQIKKRTNFKSEFVYKGDSNFNSKDNINYPPIIECRPIRIDIKEKIKFDKKLEKYICIIHIFYVDVGINIIKRLISLGVPFKLIITTNSKEKKYQLMEFLNDYNIDKEINIHENRGRDILPFINELKKLEINNLPILHLHTKKSPHELALKDWGNDILDKLISNTQNVLAILQIFEKTNVGIIYPEFIEIIKKRINWGYNYEKARFLLNNFDIDVDVNDFLTFPAGSMMWIRASAIKQLIKYEFEEDFFDKEAGQEDGTGAHAIERIFFHICKKNGYEYLSITSDYNSLNMENKKKSAIILPTFTKVSNLIHYCKRYISPEFKNKIKGFLKQNHESIIYPVLFKKNPSVNSRINLIIPTLEPEKTYGGISTALRIFKELVDSGDFDQIRCIVTTDKVSMKAIGYFSELMQKDFNISRGNGYKEDSNFTILPLKTNQDRIIDLKENDKYMATAWWTADLGFRCLKEQKKIFKKNKKLIYLIQDYEPIFYPNGDLSTKAKSTYLNEDSTIAILNSEELYNFFKNNYKFSESYYIPFELNQKLAKELSNPSLTLDARREKLIICYGRPSTPRNCFGSILDAINYWQSNDDINHVKQWKICFIGEDFSEDLLVNLQNTKVLGKLSLENYARIMLKAKIGISLMESPHPSYPPLEMAIFGVKVITNDYEAKNLSVRNKNIINIKSISQNAIFQKLKILTRESVNNNPKLELNAPYCEGKVYDPKFLNNFQDPQ